MFNAADRILVVAPHGLDEVLGAGGTLARASKIGLSLHLLVLFGDGTGRDEARRVSTEACANLLGVKSIRYGGFSENRGDVTPLVDLVGAVEGAIKESAPDVVLTAHGGSLHIDHHRTARAAVTAARPVPRAAVKSIYGFEIQSSTEWAVDAGSQFSPTVFVDISSTLQTKLDALALYGDEMRSPPHARSLKSAENLARTRGAASGFEAAEAFTLLRQVV